MTSDRAASVHFLFTVTALCAAQASNNPWLLAFALCVVILFIREEG